MRGHRRREEILQGTSHPRSVPRPPPQVILFFVVPPAQTPTSLLMPVSMSPPPPILVVGVLTPHLAFCPLDSPFGMQQGVHNSPFLITLVPTLSSIFSLLLVLLPLLFGKVRPDGPRNRAADGSQSAAAVLVS